MRGSVIAPANIRFKTQNVLIENSKNTLKTKIISPTSDSIRNQNQG